MGLNNLYNTIRKLKEFDEEAETMQIISENFSFIEFLLTEQLVAGYNGVGKKTTIFGVPEYQESTIIKKIRYGKGAGYITNRVTLYMTGDFHNSIRAEVKGNKSFAFTSDVPYYKHIIEMSGPEIMKLNRKNLAILKNEIIIPELRKRYNQS